MVGLGACEHGIHHSRHYIDRIDPIRLPIHLIPQGRLHIHHRGEIHTGFFEHKGIRGKGLPFHTVNEELNAVGQRQDQGDTDNADRPGKGNEDGTCLLGQQVVQAQRQSGEEGHRYLFLLFLPMTLCLLIGAGHGVVSDPSVQELNDTGGIFLGKLRVVGDHDDQPILGNLLQKLHDLHTGVGIQSACGLVSQ